MEKFELVRRHTKSCRHRDKGRGWTKCSCPIYCDGFLNGKRVRRSLGRDWSRAVERVERYEKGEVEEVPQSRAVRLGKAAELFLADAAGRKIHSGSLRNYERLLNVLIEFAGADAGLDKEFLATLMLFRSQRTGKASTQRHELALLRAFCAFCVEHDYMPKNWAKKLRMPKDEGAATMPYTNDEVVALFKALDSPEFRFAGKVRVYMRAFMLVLLYTGLRVSDAVKLRRAAVNRQSGKMLLRITKTAGPLYLKLRDHVLEALDALPNTGGEFYFWSGQSVLKTKISAVQSRLTRIGELAGGIHCHPHRFRDTFARQILENGASLRTLQHLLGHKSIRTTERHYAHFVKEHQQLLDAAVQDLSFGEPATSFPVDTSRDRLGDAKGDVISFPASA